MAEAPVLAAGAAIASRRQQTALRRVYLDGLYGIGKTTVCRLLVSGQLPEAPVIFFPEPMAYWRRLFDTDALRALWNVPSRLRKGELTKADAEALIAHYQNRLAAPYLIIHAKMSALVGTFEACDPEHAGITTLLFDRHPVAACVCFPLARYFLGDLQPAALLGLMATLPPEPPGGTLLVGLLSLEEQAMRQEARGRTGERADRTLAAALHGAYLRLLHTGRYLETGRNWRDDWNHLDWEGLSWSGGTDADPVAPPRSQGPAARPDLADTIFAVFKVPGLCGPDGRLMRVHAWALDALAAKLRNLTMLSVEMTGPPHRCANAIRAQYPYMPVTVTTTVNIIELRELAWYFTSEMVL